MSLAELVAAYEMIGEEPRRPLLDAMEEQGGITEARRLAAAEDRGERLLAAKLMRLLPDDGHLEALTRLVRDPDPEVAEAAEHALRLQRQTPEWQAATRELGL